MAFGGDFSPSGTRNDPNLGFFHHLSPAVFPHLFLMLSGKGTSWKPQNEIIQIFLHWEGWQGSHVLPETGKIGSVKPVGSHRKSRMRLLKGLTINQLLINQIFPCRTWHHAGVGNSCPELTLG